MAPLRGPVRRYYTPYEVAMHNTPDDVWVSFLGKVYELTKLVKDNPGPLVEPLIKAAGTDISHWFDPHTNEPRTQICPETNLLRPYCPLGRFVHVPPKEPVSNWSTLFGIAWWKDTRYQIGRLSMKTRVVRMKNVLTSQEDCLEVPEEESLVEIRERYLELNWHAKSYTWKALVKDRDGNWSFDELDMNKTLDENGVVDENPEFEDHHVPTDYYVPVLHVYWNDDLTVS